MILLKNGLIAFENTFARRDVLIDGEKVVRVAENIDAPDGCTVKNVDGMWVMPAAVDVHAHLREPGFEHKETIKTGTLGAAKSGIATLVSMPNLKPVPDSIEHLKVQQNIIDRDAVVRVYPAASVSTGEKGESTSDIVALNDVVPMFTDDGVCVNNLDVLNEAMKLAKKPIASHAEARGAKTSEEAEIFAVEREIELLRKHPNAKYHFCHLSTKESFELVKNARRDGLDVTCEVMPHHLFLNKSQIKDANWKMNPPLRSEEDRQATVDALLSGVAEIIATDHAPHSVEEKSRDYDKAPNGILGFETLLPLCYTNLVKSGLATPKQLVEWTSKNPAERFDLPYGKIEQNALADITVLDIKTEREYREDEIVSKSRNTPFVGFRLSGFPILTIVGGKIVFEKN